MFPGQAGRWCYTATHSHTSRAAVAEVFAQIPKRNKYAQLNNCCSLRPSSESIGGAICICI